MQEIDTSVKNVTPGYKPQIFKKDFFDTLIKQKKTELNEPLIVQAEREKEEEPEKQVNT
jgi:hypothetical protein